MPECRNKVSLASIFLQVVNILSPASAFRHQGQPGAAGHELVRHCKAIIITYNHQYYMESLELKSDSADGTYNLYLRGCLG
jgi:hypothetical protein